MILRKTGSKDHLEGSLDMAMNKRQADKEFNQHVKPDVIAQYGKHDKIALITAWNDWTDMLCKDGEITQKQYATWQCPVKDNRK